MIDHLTFGVSDLASSVAFYDGALAPLGIKHLFDLNSGAGRRVGYGDARPQLWLAEHDQTRDKLHIAFTAPSRKAVDAFHQQALVYGGTDNGRPGYRAQYHPGYYAAFVLDPDGHNIEAVFHDPSKLSRA